MNLVVRGATLVDGTGSPARRGDALVVDGRIAELGEVETTAGARVLDATGLVLAPGFIDLHAHSDLAVLTDPEHLAKTTQGVTTEVVGQDGLSYAPVDDAALDVLREQLAGWNGVPDLAWDWRTVGEYLDRVDRGAAVNVAYLVPQGTVRMVVVGTQDRPATAAELVRMQDLVATGMAEGAFGMSSGLTYVPGMFADTAELVALCEVVARAGGFYAPHQRSYGRGALEAYAEVVEVARRSGVALHLTHATMNFAVNAGRAGEFLSLVDAALADGVDVTLDTYPYLPGSTTLAAVLPSWASAGGPAAVLARLEDRRRCGASGTRSRSRVPTAATASWRSGGRCRSPASGTPNCPASSARRSPRSPRPAVPRSSTCSSTCSAATAWGPRSCSTSGTRRTCARSCGTRGTAAAVTASWWVRGRTRGPGGPSRATSGTTCARKGSSAWRSAWRT